MRHWLSALGATCALANVALAQQPAGPGPTAIPGGQVVSSSFNLNPAGTRLPAAAPQAGSAIGSPLMRPYDPSKPLDVFKGTNINPKNVIAPVSGFPGLATQQPDLLDRVYAKLGSVTSFLRPSAPTQPTPNVTPGIFRRNRERNMANWRRD